MYRRIIAEPTLRAEFLTDETTDAYWARQPRWSPAIDVREETLVQTGRYEDAIDS